MSAALVHFVHLPEFLLKIYSILAQMAQYIPWIEETLLLQPA